MKTAAITPDVVQKVAQLAHLNLTSGQLQHFSQQLSSVLGYVSKIQALDTHKIAETSQVTGQENIYREDEVETERMFSQEEALSNAKDAHNGFFVVKAIFED